MNLIDWILLFLLVVCAIGWRLSHVALVEVCKEAGIELPWEENHDAD